ncbi:hypothetical protein LOTGIDRAFT_153524 [Lottia gigantea]|uniref:Uncharacterized protein n=1 Tax=Lottia gigantea TaxID=225164 RepID=V4AKF9_LOTGI|nr:hypothetical protein LOTGIDRAFT_153524 [Lottia gigantea]ESO94041.1 hypothetical protein LOTGIDRAFT_153524 [Lottia gigantea]
MKNKPNTIDTQNPKQHIGIKNKINSNRYLNMFDWIKSRFPGRYGKYDVPQRVHNDVTEKGKSRVQQDLKHKVQVTVNKNKEINIISPSAEIVEVTSSFKQSPIENFFTSDDEPVSFATTSFKDFTDKSSGICLPLNVIDTHSLQQNCQLSECVLVDLIQFKEHDSKLKSYETDSDSGRSSLSYQSSSQSCESLVSISKDNPYPGHTITRADSRTSLYLSDSEYSFDSQCPKLVKESVYIRDNEYSFHSGSCLHSESQTIDNSRMEHLFSECTPLSLDNDQMESLSKNSLCLSNSCYSFDSDNIALHKSFNRSYITSVSKSSVCVSDCNHRFDSMNDAFEDELPTFNPKIGFGLNRWYKH